MIIIAGAGPKMEKHLLKTEKHCFRCNNTSRWILQKTRHFVTLFFLPVIPYKTDYLMYCPVCKNAIRLNRDDYEQKVRFESEPLKK